MRSVATRTKDCFMGSKVSPPNVACQGPRWKTRKETLDLVGLGLGYIEPSIMKHSVKVLNDLALNLFDDDT
jgi:hypothetical protein